MTDEQGAHASRRPRRAVWIAAGVVVALVVGGVIGGLIGRATTPGPAIVVAPGPVVEQSPAASTLPVSGDIAPVGTAAPRPGLEVVTGTGRPPAVFAAASDLVDTPTTASGYRLTRGQVDGAALAARLAEAVGLAGEVTQTTTGWVVGDPAETSAPSLTVADDPLLTWTYVDPAQITAGAGLSPQRAQSLGSALLSGIGVDPGAIDWEVERYSDATQVTAWQVLNGARTSLAWRLAFGPGGVLLRASGFAAGLVEIPGYPVIGAATAVRRASLPAWAYLGPRPADALTTGTAATQSPTPSATPVGTAIGRPALRVPMSGIVVTGAELGLAQFWQPDGDLLILPAYRLTGDDGSQWSLIAVSGEDVHFIDVPYPSASPTAS